MHIWPSSPIVVDTQVREAIHRFFEISNSTDPDSGALFANELFTEDGIFKTHETCVFRGRKEIASSRGQNNPAITSRGHELVKVFATDSPATDIVVLGNFKIGIKDGSTVVDDFTARFRVAANRGEGVRFESVRVWMDPTEMITALKRVAETPDAE